MGKCDYLIIVEKELTFNDGTKTKYNEESIYDSKGVKLNSDLDDEEEFILSRGIDFRNIGTVILIDPQNFKYYQHR